jgi:hypothetical protein
MLSSLASKRNEIASLQNFKSFHSARVNKTEKKTVVNEIEMWPGICMTC